MQLSILQKYSSPPPWKLQNTGQWHEYGIWNACYCLPSVLGRRSQPNYPGYSFRTCLHHLLLDAHQPHTMTATWRCSIWMFCYCTQCSIYPAVISSRWRLREWFQHWLTNTFTKNTMHTPHFQHGTCILWPSTHYTPLPSYHTTLWHTTNLSKTSVLPPNIYFWQFREWPGSRQLIRQLIRILRWRRRFPNSTYRQWTLDNRDGTRKDILHTWKWVTQQCMSIPMPLWE